MKHSNVCTWLIVTMLTAPIWMMAGVVDAATCVVDNTQDTASSLPPVTGSLRACLAGAGSGDTVLFDPTVFDPALSDAATTIGVVDALPPLDDGDVTIDASNRRVTINGSAAGSSSGLVLSSAENRVRGLGITGFASGGILIVDSADNVVGGLRAGGTGPNGQGLRISGNGTFGIEIRGAGSVGNVIKGSIVELNTGGGVLIQGGATRNVIGGPAPADANVLANNGGNGVEVRAVNSRRNSARSNRISRNKRAGIALFDGSNDAIQPPRIASIQNLGPNAAGTGSTFRVSGTTPQPGSVEIFNDSGDQGETFVTRSVANNGTWTADVDLAALLNLNATVTDSADNTSAFGGFGYLDQDSDDDGVSDILEELAATDPGDALDTPTLAGAVTLSRVQIKLNFTKTDKDSLQVKASIGLPPGFTPDGAAVGVYVAGSSEHFVLDAKGKAASATGKFALKISKGTFAMQYQLKKTTLGPIVEPFGLRNATTPKAGEQWVVPVAVTVGKLVYTQNVELKYTAKQGKTGSAK